MIEIRVVGVPAPKGSKKAFVVAGRAVVTDVSNKSSRDRLTPWKLAVTAAIQRAIEAAGNPTPIDGPIAVTAFFRLPRPASTPKRVKVPAKKPDIDKLLRTVFDLCTRTVWSDDARIVELWARKRFADLGPPGMILRVAAYVEDV